VSHNGFAIAWEGVGEALAALGERKQLLQV
jgi:hypothetical protein